MQLQFVKESPIRGFLRKLVCGKTLPVWLGFVAVFGGGCANVLVGGQVGQHPEERSPAVRPSEQPPEEIETQKMDDPFIVRIDQLEEAPVEVREGLPKIPPIWKRPLSISKSTGKLTFTGVGSLLALDRCPAGEEDHCFVKPSPERNLCGFRLLCVTSQCAWLEVVYSEPAEKIRTRWPSLTIENTIREDGKSFKRVVVEGDIAMEPGMRANFSDRESIILDSEGAFLSRNAVLFHYENDENNSVADVLCITR